MLGIGWLRRGRAWLEAQVDDAAPEDDGASRQAGLPPCDLMLPLGFGLWGVYPWPTRTIEDEIDAPERFTDDGCEVEYDTDEARP